MCMSGTEGGRTHKVRGVRGHAPRENFTYIEAQSSLTMHSKANR